MLFRPTKRDKFFLEGRLQTGLPACFIPLVSKQARVMQLGNEEKMQLN
jgi:hypothetical protein